MTLVNDKLDRNWMVLLIGGASGTGKSTLAYNLGEYYGVNVMEVDDIHLAVEKVTTGKDYPAIHYWEQGINWKEIGVERNVQWLQDVSAEMNPILKALIERHLEDQVPIILEGDFIDPRLLNDIESDQVKGLFVYEENQKEIIQNYWNREGGEPQDYRAQISVNYGKVLAEYCDENGLCIVDARPWDTSLDRAILCIHQANS